MSRVQVLEAAVAQQIAAGEVVDRPASVVKELAENSLDAGATRIEVELADGGTSRILVRDNGYGMDQEDARLSVLRHATSKVRSLEDIEGVATLGFRGEALPSIASVSSFSLTTSTDGASATRVTVEGGAKAEVSAAAHPKGTTVLADRLLYNVPARRAFLRGIRTERAAIIETLNHLAAAHPGVGFRLAEGGRDYLSLPEAESLEVRLAQLHGVASARAMRRVDYESGAFRITGYAALPSLTHGSRASQTVAVNGRWVRSENLHRGLDDGYRQTTPSGRYPPVALNIEVDPRRVDVNVHPTKQVVRFSDERAAREAVGAAVRAAIEWRPAPRAASPRPPAPPPSQQRLSFTPPRVAEPRPSYPTTSPPDLERTRREMAQTSHLTPEPPAEERPARGDLPPLEELRVIGQLAAGYILTEEPGEALWVVDQHVAHERAILDRLNEGELGTVQELLIPEVVELSTPETELASEKLSELAVYGFEAEPFGPASYRVTGVLSTLAGGDIGGAFKEALRAVSDADPGRPREERLLATIACHSAVKMGDRLSIEEMEQLIREWLQSRLPATCPHGRSICYRMGLKELGRKFDRH